MICRNWNSYHQNRVNTHHILTKCETTEEVRKADLKHQTVLKLLWTATGIKTALAI
jgi:hypothetical protein